MKRLFTILFFLAMKGLHAGGDLETQGARSLALGGASLTLSDAWSGTNNPGALGRLSRYSFAMAYENKTMLAQTGMRAACLSLPLGGGTAAISAHNYGFGGYQSNRAALTYGRKLSDYLDLGIGINYVQVRMGDVYGSRATMVGEVGMILHPSNNMSLGVHVYNPTRAKIADIDDERITSSLRIGMSYLFSEKVRWLLEVDKDIDLPINVKSGIEYRPVEAVFIRGGYGIAQNNIAFGVGYRWNNVSADVGASWNQNLGYSSALSVTIDVGKRKKNEA